MKDIMDKLADTGIIPVVVLEHAADAVPAAKALLAGGVGAMEITFRTAAAPDAIEAVSKECPEMLVGAGTVITLEQCRQAVSLGARFIVSPGVDEEVVRWCVENNVAVTPGCVTPSEIMSAMKLGIDVVKLFPASVYGGLKAMKALAGPFGKLKFIPTGGIDASNCGEYAASPFVHAIGEAGFAPRRISRHISLTGSPRCPGMPEKQCLALRWHTLVSIVTTRIPPGMFAVSWRRRLDFLSGKEAVRFLCRPKSRL